VLAAVFCQAWATLAVPAALSAQEVLPGLGSDVTFTGGPLPAMPPGLNSLGAVLLDASTGTVLYEKNGTMPIPPASLTKLMTIHLALNDVAAGKAGLDEEVFLPRESWAVNQPYRSSLMFLAEGQHASLRELILGMAIPSGNDAAVATALRFAPTVEDFVDRMNREAARLGLNQTVFAEPSGVSEWNITTALDFARFCREYLEKHPEALENYHSVQEFSYPLSKNMPDGQRNSPKPYFHRNHNSLLGNVEGVDGLKTGYIDESGYNIALSAKRGGTRLIAVTLGASSIRNRDADGRSLLNWGFENFKTLDLDIGTLDPVRVWKGKQDQLSVTPAEPLCFTAPAGRGTGLWWEAVYDDPLIAPIPAGTQLGELTLYDSLGELRRVPVAAAEEAEQGGFFKRLWDGIRLFFRRHFG
jgi:D-alanyl-D-alanine carboxypeptidase (penicillin-binding protein 5/6)